MSLAKRVLVSIQAPNYGGPHNQVFQMFERLRDEGYEYVGLLPNEDGSAKQRFSEKGISFVSIRLTRFRKTMNPLYYLKFFFGLPNEITGIRKAIREEGVDLVQVCGALNFQTAIAAKLEKKPIVWQVLSDYTPYVLRLIFSPLICNLSDCIMTTGKKVALKHPGFIKHQYLVPFFPPVDISKIYYSLENRSELRRLHGVTEDEVVIGTLGNFSKQKSHEILVESFKKIVTKKKVKLFLLGSYIETNRSYYEEVVEKTASDLISLGLCHIIEPGNRAHDYLSCLDIFVLSSRAEGVPTVMLEAMACSLPVISTDVGSIAEYIPDLEDLIPVNDTDKLATAISRLVNDPGIMKTKGDKSKVLSLVKYNLENCVRIHKEVFIKVSNKYENSRS